jgi:hypothetical protein
MYIDVCVCVWARLAMHVSRNTATLSRNVMPPRLSRQRDNISLEEKVFMAI